MSFWLYDLSATGGGMDGMFASENVGAWNSLINSSSSLSSPVPLGVGSRYDHGSSYDHSADALGATPWMLVGIGGKEAGFAPEDANGFAGVVG